MMKPKLREIVLAGLALALCSCATTSVKSTWKSPDYQGGAVKNVAVLAMDEGSGYRPMFEAQFVAQLGQSGQPAFKTEGLLTRAEVKADKEAAAAKLRDAGADSVLVVRLVDSVNKSTLAPSTRGGRTVTTDAGKLGWMDYYTVSVSGPARMQQSLSRHVYIETSLYQLASGQKIGSVLTKTVLHDDADRMAEVEPLVATVLTSLRADGLVR